MTSPPEVTPAEVPGDTRSAPAQRDAISFAGAADALPKGPLSEGAILPDARVLDAPEGDAVPAELRATESRAAESRAAGENPPPRREDSRPVTDQMTEIARRLPDGPVEVTLSPEELGKVRFSILGAEGQMSVQIVAERAETLDLLRRHIDVLEAELRQQGYDGVSFSFGQGGGGAGAEPGERAPALDDDRSFHEAPLRTEPVDRRQLVGGSLDLRL